MYFSYSLTALWHDLNRFLPGVLAVAFSALLIALQWGLLLGMFTFASVLIDRARADIWVGGPSIRSADLGQPISEYHLARLATQPEVERAELYVQQRSHWVRPDGCRELCLVIGSRLEEGAIGAVPELNAELRGRLAERGAVIVDQTDLERLGIAGAGEIAEINGQRVKVVGLISGFRGLAGAHVFCSLETARALLLMRPNQANYVLAQCHDPADAPAVVQRIRESQPQLSAFTADKLSRLSRRYWLIETKGGLALGYGALLGLLVGAVVTSQTLYGATAAQLREYAVLWALGIPVRRMAALVLAQAVCVGVAGVVLALPAIYLMAAGANLLNLQVRLPVWLLGATMTVTLVMAFISGLAALRSLRRIEPAVLLR